MIETQPCSKVIFVYDPTPEDLDIEERAIPEDHKYIMDPFSPRDDLTPDIVDEMLVDLLLVEEDEDAEEERRLKKKKKKLTWEEKVNDKRRRVQQILETTGAKTIKELAQKAGVSKALASEAFKHFQATGEVEAFEYNNKHSQETMDAMDNLIEDPAMRYLTAADVMREIPARVSKKIIRRRLKEKGFAYKRIKKPGTTQKTSHERYRDPGLPSTISMISQLFGRLDKEIFFLDEAKFPLHSTGQYCWLKKETELMYNDRPDNTTLHAICLCSKHDFVAVQFFLDEIKTADVLYFLKTFLSTHVTSPEIIILLDNAA